LVKRRAVKLEVVEPPLPSQRVDPFEVNVDPSSFTSSDELPTWKEVVAAITGFAANHPNNNVKMSNP
jgi:hypothetical protein